MTDSIFFAQTAGDKAPTLTVNGLPLCDNRALSQEAVGEFRQDLTDVELERHITSCGELMLAAYGRYEASSDLQDRAEADRWRLMQAQAIAARRPGWIASMDLARGLAA